MANLQLLCLSQYARWLWRNADFVLSAGRSVAQSREPTRTLGFVILYLFRISCLGFHSLTCAHRARKFHRKTLTVVLAYGYLFPLLSMGLLHAAEMKFGDRIPYRIELLLAVDSRRRPQEELASRLARVLSQRVDATMSPFWDLEISVLQGRARHQLLARLDSTFTAPFANENATPWQDFKGNQPPAGKHPDKWMLLTVTAVPVGYLIRCREWDAYVRRWGSLRQRTLSQQSLLAESCFQLMREVFAPLAVVHPMSGDDGQSSTSKQVVVQFKGSQLASEPVEQLFLHPGDVYQPLLRRTDRSGDLLEVSEVPWTYLVLAEAQSTEQTSHDRQWRAHIHSGLRHPFGIRLRGRSELLALAMHTTKPRTQVRFFARHDRAQALSGYEVFEQSEPREVAQPLVGYYRFPGDDRAGTGTGACYHVARAQRRPPAGQGARGPRCGSHGGGTHCRRYGPASGSGTAGGNSENSWSIWSPVGTFFRPGRATSSTRASSTRPSSCLRNWMLYRAGTVQ